MTRTVVYVVGFNHGNATVPFFESLSQLVMEVVKNGTKQRLFLIFQVTSRDEAENPQCSTYLCHD